MTNLTKGLFLSIAANLAALGSSLIIVGVATRVLTKEDMGAFFMAMVIALFAGTVADLGLRNGVIRVLSVARGSYDNSAMPFLVTLGVVRSLADCGALIVAAAVVSYFLPASVYIKPLAWGGLVTFAMGNWQMALAVLVGQQRYQTLSLLSLGVELLRIVVSVTILLAGGGMSGLILGIVVSRLTGFVLFGAMSSGQIYCCISTPNSKELLTFSAWGYGSAVISIVTGRLGDFVLNSQLGAAALATYSTAMQVPLIVNRGYESIRPVVLAYVAAKGEKGLRTVVVGSRLITGALSIMALLVMISANTIVPLIFSVRYSESVPITVILSIWVVVGLTNYFISTALFGVGRSREVFWFSLAQLPVMVGLCFTIVPLYGGAGAAGALVITSAIGNLLYAFMFGQDESEVATALVKLLLVTQIPLVLCAYAITTWDMSTFARLMTGASAFLSMVLLGGVRIGEMIAISRKLFFPMRRK